MAELILGALLGVCVGARFGLGFTAVLVVAGFAAIGLYLVSCAIWPHRKCWRCRGAKWRGDGRGNLRPRRCRVCGGRGNVRRAGARLIGMGSS